MAGAKQESSVAQTLSLIGLLAVAVGAVVVFQAGAIDLSFFMSKPSYDSALMETISVKGPVKVKDLNLSKSEIRKINYAALRCQELFPSMDVILNMADQFAPIKVNMDTELILGLALKAEETEVTFYNRTLERKNLVPHMVRSMEEAAEEFTHIKALPDRTAPIERLYL